MTAPPPWTAERSVSLKLARELIAGQFPELAPVRVESPTEGWDNVAYRVNGEWIFRFPRRTIAVELIRTEAAVLPVIAPRLPFPIPLPVFVGEPEERFPWPFAGYRELSGRTACRADLSDDQRARAAAPLGRFLRALHAIPSELASRAGPSSRRWRSSSTAPTWATPTSSAKDGPRCGTSSPDPWSVATGRRSDSRGSAGRPLRPGPRIQGCWGERTPGARSAGRSARERQRFPA